jgi:hypothetical protein
VLKYLVHINATIFGVIEENTKHARQAIYSIPANKTAYIMGLCISVG